MFPEYANEILLCLWTILSVCVGFRMGRQTCGVSEPKEPKYAQSKEPYSFEEESGYVEDELLKETEERYRSINQNKVEKGEDL